MGSLMGSFEKGWRASVRIYIDSLFRSNSVRMNILILSYNIMEETPELVVVKIKRGTHNKARYEANKDYILKYCKHCYASFNKKQYGNKV